MEFFGKIRQQVAKGLILGAFCFGCGDASPTKADAGYDSSIDAQVYDSGVDAGEDAGDAALYDQEPPFDRLYDDDFPVPPSYNLKIALSDWNDRFASHPDLSPYLTIFDGLEDIIADDVLLEAEFNESLPAWYEIVSGNVLFKLQTENRYEVDRDRDSFYLGVLTIDRETLNNVFQEIYSR